MRHKAAVKAPWAKCTVAGRQTASKEARARTATIRTALLLPHRRTSAMPTAAINANPTIQQDDIQAVLVRPTVNSAVPRPVRPPHCIVLFRLGGFLRDCPDILELDCRDCECADSVRARPVQRRHEQ